MIKKSNFLILLLLSFQCSIYSQQFKQSEVPINGNFDVLQFGVSLYNSSSDSIFISVPGKIEYAFIDWTGSDDNTPVEIGKSTLTINNTEITSVFSNSEKLGENYWYSWHADIGPSGSNVVENNSNLFISGYENIEDTSTNGATITIVFSNSEIKDEREINLLTGLDYYFFNSTNNSKSELLKFKYKSSSTPRKATLYLSFAGTDHNSLDCRGNAVWMLSGKDSIPNYNLFKVDENGKGFGINNSVEILNDPFSTNEFSCVPKINPFPDQPYEPGHNYPEGAAKAPYRALSLKPQDGGFVGPEWSIIKVELLIPAESEWSILQFESEKDQEGESGSITGGIVWFIENFNTEIGDFVWLDLNKNGIQDDEPGLGNISVQLFNEFDSLTAGTTTNNEGYYSFNNFLPGIYSVKFNSPNFQFTKQGVGDNNLNSDADTITGKTKFFTVNDNQAELSIDAGLVISNNPVDLSIEKSLLSVKIKKNEPIEFEIKLINQGEFPASNIVVKDFLPEELRFESFEAERGFYDSKTNEWFIPFILNDESVSLKITTSLQLSVRQDSSFNLRAASDFNVFVFEDLIQPSSDTEGKMAVGGNIHLQNYSVGYKLRNSYNGAVLVAGNQLEFISGAVYGGDVVYGNSTNLPINLVSISDGNLIKDNPIDFISVEKELIALSDWLSKLEINGITEKRYSELYLTGNDDSINVFNVSGNDLSNSVNLILACPKNSIAIVNVDGSEIDWSGGLLLDGIETQNVLYNFSKVDSLAIHHIQVEGSILAPETNVNFISGVQNGQMISKSLKGIGQFNLNNFKGLLPQDSLLINYAEIIRLDQNDIDSTPNNGNVNEDDYSSVTIIVSADDLNSTITGGSNNSIEIKEFILKQNYPNPFNPKTNIEFNIPIEGQYKIVIFNSLGEKVKEILDTKLTVGIHSVEFSSRGLSSGIYIYSLTGNNVSISKKMLLLK